MPLSGIVCALEQERRSAQCGEGINHKNPIRRGEATAKKRMDGLRREESRDAPREAHANAGGGRVSAVLGRSGVSQHGNWRLTLLGRLGGCLDRGSRPTEGTKKNKKIRETRPGPTN